MKETTMTRARSARRSGFLAPIALGAALLTGACGDDDAGATDEGDRLSAAEFVEQADQACADATSALEAAITPAFAAGEPTPEAMATATDAAIEVVRSLRDDLDALAEPAESSDDLDAYLTALDEASDAAETAGPDAFFETLGNGSDPWAGTNALADDLGLAACAG
jgi:hypothetical protein